jgi:hypothetical protein
VYDAKFQVTADAAISGTSVGTFCNEKLVIVLMGLAGCGQAIGPQGVAARGMK